MKGWSWHESLDRDIPNTVHGSGWSDVRNEPGKDFDLDEKTGLLIPKNAAKDRRKVKIGFAKETE